MAPKLCVMLVAGEASGDQLGAALARSLKQSLGENVRFVGVGGSKMAAEGVESIFELSDVSILGFFDGLLGVRRIHRRADAVAKLAKAEEPAVAVLIDSWGFTLRVARALRRVCPELPLVKYVGPQLWASRPGRAKTLARSVDHLVAIDARDAGYYEPLGLPVTFVGNPTLALDLGSANPDRLRARLGLNKVQQVLLLLPGSRPSEVARLLPVFHDVVDLLALSHPNLAIVLPVAPTVADTVKNSIAQWRQSVHVVEGELAKLDAMRAATVALACSGTVTTELALAGCPVVVCYRVGALNYLLMRWIVRTPYITLFNIAAEAPVAPEYIQHQCNAQALANAIDTRLNNRALRERQTDRQSKAVAKMGRAGSDPSLAAANAVLGVLARTMNPDVHRLRSGTPAA